MMVFFRFLVQREKKLEQETRKSQLSHVPKDLISFFLRSNPFFTFTFETLLRYRTVMTRLAELLRSHRSEVSGFENY